MSFLKPLFVRPKAFPLNRLLTKTFSSDCNTPDEKKDIDLFEKYKKFQFPAIIERQINEQIGHELYASHVCLSIAQYFYNTELCLTGFGDFFRRLSNEERQHALLLTDYQNKRGGCVQLCKIDEPPKCEYQTLCDPFMCMLEIEHGVTERLFKLIECAFKQRDYATALFISDKFAEEQMDSIRELNCMINRIKLATENHGILHLDKEFSKNRKNK